jgi:hypothetical protein
MTDIDRAILRLLIQGNDGGWDYYPFGFKKPGYRTNAALLDEVVRIERGGPKRALIGIAAIAILLYVVLPNLAATHPQLVPLANSPIIRLAVAVPLLALVYLVVTIRRRFLLRGLLADRIAQRPPLSAAAILARRAQYWRMTPWFSRIAMFIGIPLVTVAMALYAAQRAAQVDAMAPWEAGLAAGFAVALVTLYGFIVYRVMSFRGVASTRE